MSKQDLEYSDEWKFAKTKYEAPFDLDGFLDVHVCVKS